MGAAAVRVDGDTLDAEVAAAYLAGAGIGMLRVHERLVAGCRALNSAVHIEPGARAGALAVAVGSSQHVPPDGASPVARGAGAARWAIARVLST